MEEYGDPYEILGIARDSSFEEAKKKYHSLVLKYHPDKTQDSSHFIEIQEAWESLKRTRIFVDKEDISKVPVSLRDLIYGGPKSVQVVKYSKCQVCKCNVCNMCGGTGQSTHFMLSRYSKIQCLSCHGLGFLPSIKCLECKGLGTTPKTSIQIINVPKNAKDGSFVDGFQIYHDFEENVTLDPRGHVLLNVDITLQEVMCGFHRSIELTLGRVDIDVKTYRDPTEPLFVVDMARPLKVTFNIIYPPANSKLSRCKGIFQKIFQ
jgi:DnaJ-class molecular chaperone